MGVSKKVFSRYIGEFAFRELFNEMGWNNDRFRITYVKPSYVLLFYPEAAISG